MLICAAVTNAQVFEAGHVHVLIVCKSTGESSGNVETWGWNGRGQLGLGPGSDPNVFQPVTIPNLNGVTAVQGGATHSLVLKSNGTVMSFGENEFGQLGLGDTSDRYSPTAVPGLTNIRAIAAGWSHSLALDNNGHVWVFGNNHHGQLGLGDTLIRTTPQQVPNLSNVAKIGIARHHSFAIKNDGTLWIWGMNTYGQLGTGTIGDLLTPVQVPGLTNVTMVTGGDQHSFALKSDGTVWSWGMNFMSQLGLPGNGWVEPVTQIPGLSGIVSIVSGRLHGMALKNDGTVWCWGSNGYGQIGNNTFDEQDTPLQVAALGNNVLMIAADGESNYALTSDGNLWGWGLNGSGQLGNGQWLTQSELPQQVIDPCVLLTMGLSANRQASLSLFPNPAEDQVTFDTDAIVKTVTVHAADGRIVACPADLKQHTLDVAHLASGVYTVTIETREGLFTGRFVRK